MNKKYIIYYFFILLIFIKIFKKTENFMPLLFGKIRKYFDIDSQSLINLSLISHDLLKNDKLELYGGLDVTGRFNYLPKGIIIAWNSTKIPSGWVICDGKNKTPNLINRFIFGYGSGKAFKTYGGQKNVTLKLNNLPKHQHTVTIGSGGSHDHKIESDRRLFNSSTYKRTNFCRPTKRYVFMQGDKWMCADNDFKYWKRFEGVNFTALRNTTLNTAGSHSHRVTIGSIGSSNSHNNMPPYYVLIWIMKL